MKKIIFAIFAHPDDESFGPSGVLLQESLNGNDVHLISLTRGEGGMNPDNYDNLGEVRLAEWHEAGKIMKVTSQSELGYRDGHLCNEDMIEASQKIMDLVRLTISQNESDEIEFMTNDLNGISGHIDHIVAARAACLAFFRLKNENDRFTRIRLTCVPKMLLPKSNVDWLYMEAGRTDDEIDEVVDARHLRDEIIRIMRCHNTQRSDGESHIKQRGSEIGMHSFIDKY